MQISACVACYLGAVREDDDASRGVCGVHAAEDARHVVETRGHGAAEAREDDARLHTHVLGPVECLEYVALGTS
jgi:hypothetical protein